MGAGLAHERRASTRTAFFVLLSLGVLTTCKNPLLGNILEEAAIAVTPPAVSQVYPAQSAVDVPINTNTITITFTKPVDPATVNSNTVLITDAAQTKLSGTFSVSGETITFTPSANLPYNTVYTIVVTIDVKDTDGNTLAAAYTWTFSTGLAPDVTAPVIGSVTINNGAEWSKSPGVSITIVATDDYDSATASAIASMKINNGEWQTYATSFEHSLPEGEGSKGISIILKDASGNVSLVASDTILVDTLPPEIINFFINGDKASTNTLEMNAYIVAHDEGSGLTGYKFRNTVDAWTETWTELAEESVLLEGLSLPSTSENDDTYTLEAIVSDLAGNVSVTSTHTIRYDLMPPTIVSKDPDNMALNIVVNKKEITITFNDSIDINSLDATSLVLKKGLTSIPGTYVLSDTDAAPRSKLQLADLDLSQNSDYIVTLSPSIKDEAGNSYGVTTSWYFQTGIAVDTTAPTGSVVPNGFATPLPNGTFAVDIQGPLTMNITASDDYNNVYGMRIWGEGSLPDFENSAAWEPIAATKAWTLDATQRTYSLLYKLMDTAGNESPAPIQVKVIYDNTAPVVSSFGLSGGSAYSNDPEGVVTLSVQATDAGVGIKEIKYSNDANLADDAWESWSPIRPDWTLATSSQGLKTIYLSIRDYLGKTYTTVTPLSITWDTIDPTLAFVQSDHKNTNVAVALTGDFDDDFGIANYTWSMENGPGTITFSSTTASHPTASASADGVYILKLVARDNAGNESTATIPFIWDTTAPDAMGTITTSGTYSTSNRPTISWDPVTGANSYLVSIDGGATVEVETTSFTPGSDLSEAAHTFRVTPKDDAGNTAAYSDASITVDTIPPAIGNNGALFLFNASGGSISATTSDGGSGLASHSWTVLSGPGTVTFAAPANKVTNVTASQHGYYSLRMIVADAAGNTSVGNYTLNWDTIAPNAPVVTGIAHTPSVRPTWSWSTGGNGGNGTFSYRLTGTNTPSEYTGWTSPASVLSFSPGGSALPTGTNQSAYTYTLEVREYDSAGNYSAAGSYGIWVDATYTAPPEVVVVGASLRNTTSITWNWNTGAAQSGATYRYIVRENNTTVPSTPPFDSLAWINGSAGSAVQTATFAANTTSGQDETWTILVEEKSTAPGTWNAKLGSHTVRVDMKGPTAPSVTRVSSNPTNDSTPTWSWSSTAGSDGTGNFRYRIDIDGLPYTETTSTVVSASTPLSHGNHTMYVQERDALGNWSSSGSYTIAVDITAPTLTSIVLNTAAGYTNSTTVTATISATAESGMQMSFYDYNPAGWKAWEAYSSTKTIVLPAGEGTKYVYVKTRDSLGNESAYVYDTIVLDQTAPASLSLTLNGGATYTPSLDVYLDSSATDNLAPSSDWQLRYYYNGVYSSWQAYSAHALADVNFTPTVGSKTVYLQIRDGAFNETSFVSDSINLQIPTPTSADKGYYTGGTAYVNYSPITEDAGPSTTVYEVAYATDAAATPNTNPASVVSVGTTTSTSYKYVSIPKGQLLYFFVRASNADTGGIGPYSLSSVLGFSSNVTIVYNQGDTTDELLANKIKAIIEDTILSGRDIVDASTIKGTMPVWTATLLPEDMVSNTTYSSENLIYGDPVIVTHGMTLADRQTTYDNRIRNIAANGRGLIAVGSGNIFIDRVNANWTTWALSGTKPANIGYLNTATLTSATTAKFRPGSVSESIWWTPIYNNYANTSFGQETSVTATVFTATTGRHAVYLPTGTLTDGSIYVADASSTTYYPVVRQGRFLTYGFFDATRSRSDTITTYEYGLPFFVNLIARMDNF